MTAAFGEKLARRETRPVATAARSRWVMSATSLLPRRRPSVDALKGWALGWCRSYMHFLLRPRAWSKAYCRHTRRLKTSIGATLCAAAVAFPARGEPLHRPPYPTASLRAPSGWTWIFPCRARRNRPRSRQWNGDDQRLLCVIDLGRRVADVPLADAITAAALGKVDMNVILMIAVGAWTEDSREARADRRSHRNAKVLRGRRVR
jgi:hypothetical protein